MSEPTAPAGANADKDENCYLACFPARPIRLSKKHPTTIGRADGNAIVLADGDVSRAHAVVEWDGERFVIRDLESRNGIYVNDVKAPLSPLAADDRICIGNRQFTFLVGDEQAVRRLFMKKRQEQHAGATERCDAGASSSPACAFAGSLADFGLAELLQAIELGRKTGTVVVHCDAGRGEMWVREGQVLAATFGNLRNEAAIYRMLELEAGRFEFGNELADVEPQIRTKTSSLLMEGFRRIDEAHKASAAAAPNATAGDGARAAADADAAAAGGEPGASPWPDGETPGT